MSHDISPASLRRECEASLARLRVERIDLYQIHWPRWPSNPSDTGTLEDAWGTLADLKREGKVRYIGVSNCNADQLASIHRIAPVTSLQPPYAILRRDIEARELRWCEDHQVGVLAYSPMMSGLLSGRMTRERIGQLPPGDWRRKALWFQEPNLTRALEVVERLKEIASNRGVTPAEVAIAWVLKHPAVTAAIVGAQEAGSDRRVHRRRRAPPERHRARRDRCGGRRDRRGRCRPAAAPGVITRSAAQRSASGRLPGRRPHVVGLRRARPGPLSEHRSGRLQPPAGYTFSRKAMTEVKTVSPTLTAMCGVWNGLRTMSTASIS